MVRPESRDAMWRTSSGDAETGFAIRINVRRNSAKHFRYRYENKDIVEGYCRSEVEPRHVDELRMGPALQIPSNPCSATLIKPSTPFSLFSIACSLILLDIGLAGNSEVQPRKSDHNSDTETMHRKYEDMIFAPIPRGRKIQFW